MKNIYITDLDHTFLRSDLSLSDYTKKIWNSYENEAILGIATARTYKKTVQFLEGVYISAPMILLDGALIATMDKKIIDTKFIAKDAADTIIDEGARLGIYPFVLSLVDEKLGEAFSYSTTLNAYQQEIIKRYANDDHTEAFRDLRAKERNFKVVYMAEEMLLEALKQNLEAIFGDELKYILAPEAYMGCYFLTILHKDADKSHGIKSVSEAVGFDLDKLTVFGDNLNDIGMFELANRSVAVANAQEDVKEKADIVLEHTNDEDGVARYLEELKNA
ncbi:HAD-IIB family hydrolase [Sulfurimonas paralvinellae]|uniref:HAD-IIB family hydrolase n=1 Tax=Sulfurimonas paralvinellae TaxID=317658 RepID=A0A7M1B835_9BACT|nr:HAD-IIB family hydrolase [Sulfurimonas paralvinellae]QOP44892.1 HAD-IIB family hydrolase [Sulfurimonas paralvinellae]